MNGNLMRKGETEGELLEEKLYETIKRMQEKVDNVTKPGIPPVPRFYFSRREGEKMVRSNSFRISRKSMPRTREKSVRRSLPKGNSAAFTKNNVPKPLNLANYKQNPFYHNFLIVHQKSNLRRSFRNINVRPPLITPSESNPYHQQMHPHQETHTLKSILATRISVGADQ